MLTFISFWRAAAIVLNDLGSSAFYVGGIAEQAVGRAAPWFVLGVMLFSYAVRAVYIESCVMFVRGGVYKVVREAMGSTLAKVSVSALMFDYVLTGPISAVSAGQYLAGLINSSFPVLRIGWRVSPDAFSVIFALLVTLYFWRQNILGIEESSGPFLDPSRLAREVRRLGDTYGLKVDPDARVEDLPVSMQQRVEILKVLVRGARVLILDEPTAVLTPQEVLEFFQILRTLKEQGATIMPSVRNEPLEMLAARFLTSCTCVASRSTSLGAQPVSIARFTLAALVITRCVSTSGSSCSNSRRRMP